MNAISDPPARRRTIGRAPLICTPDNHGILILSGCTGAGKNTVWGAAQSLLTKHGHPMKMRRTVSCTTRLARPLREGDPRYPGMEENGVDYHFISEGDFLDMERRDQFAESAIVHGGSSYGTPRSELIPRKGESLIFAEINFAGAANLSGFLLGAMWEHRTVFIRPPGSDDEILTLLAENLRRLNTDPAEEQRRRVASVELELKASVDYHHNIINNIASGDMGAAAAKELLLEVFDITL